MLAQAVRLGLPAMLWQRALEFPAAPSAGDSGTEEQDGLAYALATALADLFAPRGGNELAAAALRILFDPRLTAWYGATAADVLRPPRIAAAAQRLVQTAGGCPCGSLGVRACPPGPRPPLPAAAPVRPRDRSLPFHIAPATCPQLAALTHGVRTAAPSQATGRNRAAQMREMTAMGRLVLQLDRYPAEALASLCHSVRGGDESDDRCAAQRASVPLRLRQACLPRGAAHPGSLGGA